MSADCTTGVINELGGCEPVGVTPTDLQPSTTVFVIDTPAVVDGPHPSIPDECWLGSDPANAIDEFVLYDINPDAPGTHSRTAMPCGPVVAEIADPPELPATGTGETLAGFAGIILAAGLFFSWAARR